MHKYTGSFREVNYRWVADCMFDEEPSGLRIEYMGFTGAI